MKRARELIPAPVLDELQQTVLPDIWKEIVAWRLRQADSPTELTDAAATLASVDMVKRALTGTYVQLLDEARAEFIASDWDARRPYTGKAVERLRNWVTNSRVRVGRMVAYWPRLHPMRVSEAGLAAVAGNPVFNEEDGPTHILEWLRDAVSGVPSPGDYDIRQCVGSGNARDASWPALWYMVTRNVGYDILTFYGTPDEPNLGVRLMDAWIAADWQGCLVTLMAIPHTELREIAYYEIARIIFIYIFGLQLETDPVFATSVLSRRYDVTLDRQNEARREFAFDSVIVHLVSFYRVDIEHFDAELHTFAVYGTYWEDLNTLKRCMRLIGRLYEYNWETGQSNDELFNSMDPAIRAVYTLAEASD